MQSYHARSLGWPNAICFLSLGEFPLTEGREPSGLHAGVFAAKHRTARALPLKKITTIGRVEWGGLLGGNGGIRGDRTARALPLKKITTIGRVEWGGLLGGNGGSRGDRMARALPLKKITTVGRVEWGGC